MLRAATDLHASQAGFTIAEVFRQRGALYLPVDNFTGMVINEENLHQMLCDVDTN